MDSKAATRLKLQLLILRTQSGSESGFKELFNSFKGLTFKYLSSLLNEADAQDIQQLVWLKVYQQISNLSSPFGFTRWLMQITHRAAVDHLNKSKKVTLVNDIELESNESLFDDETGIEVPHDFEQLHIAMNKLSFEHKEVLLLFYWQEFSCVEIAQVLSCSPGTVKSRLFNARQQLQRTKTIRSL